MRINGFNKHADQLKCMGPVQFHENPIKYLSGSFVLLTISLGKIMHPQNI